MAINTIIIEDNPQAAEALSDILKENTSVALIGVATTLEEGEEMVNEHRPTLLFIDVEMPDGNGIDFWNRLRSTCGWFMYAVFYTAYDRYAIEALRAKAFDFLVKPVDKNDVVAALNRFFTECTELFVENDKKTIAGTSQTTILVIDNHGNRIAMRIHDICLFKYISDRKIWEVNYNNGNCYTLRHGINSARILQLSNDFVQVHKSYIVNTAFVSKIDNNHIVFFPPYEDINEVQISKNYRNDLFNHFCQL